MIECQGTELDAVTLRTELGIKLAEISHTLADAKSDDFHFNEAQTELVIIDPLLHLLGYGPLQISKRGHDNVANNFPDYTLLPNTPHKWFLEAKRLDLTLQDGEAAQAVNYANNQGAEWAVLTNGRTWYIYNAHLPKPLVEKRVIQIDDVFSTSDALDKLVLLSRQSMLNGGLTQAWTFSRVLATVKHQLETPNSTIRKHLRKIASEETGTAIDEMTVGKALGSLLVSSEAASPGLILPADEGPKVETVTPPPAAPGQAVFHTFADIARDSSLATSRKPQSLLFADGHGENTKTWADAAKLVVECVGRTHSLPTLPFSTGKTGKRCFLNASDVHMSGKTMTSHRVAEVGLVKVYIETNRSATDITGALAAFMAAVGAPPETVKVSIV